jgi:hypothetical protein
MKVLVKPIGESDGNFQLSVSALLHVVGKALQRAVVTAWTYMSARHEAWLLRNSTGASQGSRTRNSPGAVSTANSWRTL